MHLPSTEQTLEQIALKTLAAKPHMTAEQLRLAASVGRKKFSPAAVYKVLSRLLDAGIVVRTGSRYSLSLSWIFEILRFTDRLSETYLSSDYISTLIPSTGKRLSWNFSDLIRCNEFWNQLLLAVLRQTSTTSVFAWVPYPWFVLLRDDRESQLHEALLMSGRSFYTSFGNCGQLQAPVEKIYRHKNHTVSFSHSPFEQLKSTYIDLVGDYILTVSLAPETSKRIQSVFSTAGRQPYLLGRHLAALSERCPVKVTLECNQRKSKRYRSIFAEFFGVQS